MKALATEMTENFGKRLEPLGLKVRELTGDTVLSRKEIEETQVILGFISIFEILICVIILTFYKVGMRICRRFETYPLF